MHAPIRASALHHTGFNYVKDYVCQADTVITGTADVKLSNGKTDDTGYSQEKCQQECDANDACKSYVYVKSHNGHCEMWSRTTGASKTDTGGVHCTKQTTGNHDCASAPWYPPLGLRRARIGLRQKCLT